MGWRDIYILPSKTALGLGVLILLLFVLATNFQNALVYLICFWLLALLVLNILHTWRNLAGLQVVVLGIEPCFAGDSALLEVEISRPAHRPKFALELRWGEQETLWLDLYHNRSERVKLAYPTTQRGWFSPPRLQVASRFPTGLVVAWAYLTPKVRGMVYPAPAAPSQALQQAVASEQYAGQVLAQGSHDFHGVRSYQHGDKPQQVHWKKFAQTGTLHSKHFVDYHSHELWLDWNSLTLPDREARLAHLCRQVLDCQQQQRSFGLRLPQQVIAPSQGAAHLARCLQALALFGVEDA